jgi:hydroxylamine reductase
MFCHQCEQTAKGTGCTIAGVCGKNEEVANLQDLLIHALQGLALYALEGRKSAIIDSGTDLFTMEAIFSTLTNVDFDPDRFVVLINRAVELREAMKNKVATKGGATNFSQAPACFVPVSDSAAELAAQGKALNLLERLDADVNIRSLKQLILFGVKGLAAYADHAAILGQTDPTVPAFCYEALVALLFGMSLDQGVDLAMKTGKINMRAMELLDAANTGAYGHPTPTAVPLGHRANKCILISGHDLADLEQLLKQTEGTGIDIYTHGEMLPCHGYPELKKYSHLYGHFGTAWQNQQKEFPHFPGPILLTTNCIQQSRDTYKDRMFTTGLVGWPGVKHIDGKDYSAMIDTALAMPGFTDETDNGQVLVGFARNTVLGMADKVIDAVTSGAIRHFFLVGGCDGAKSGRDYFTRFVEQIPNDCMVLTLACGKFRFFDKQLGNIDGIPRLLDIGQCNDAYSAVQIATVLNKAFDCGINDLPLSFVLSWYEQKAVAILLTLLYLGIKDIRLGPSLPAFISPAVLEFLVNTFDIKPVDTPEADLKAILN